MISLYNPAQGPMQVAGFMSGSGSNLRKIIEHERELAQRHGQAPYHVAVIFSDNPKSNAAAIGTEYKLPVIIHDIKQFYQERNKPLRDLAVRAEFDQYTVEALTPHHIAAAAYAGYMSIATSVLINAYLGINVHPADLSIMQNGQRKYTGLHPVRDAILAGEPELRSTTHLVSEQVDGGKILMISEALPVTINNFSSLSRTEQNTIADTYQNQLKEIGDWVIFSKTLEYLATGRFAQDDAGQLYCDQQPIPHGLKLES